ncbi:hypothetical protein T492DRAFT_904786, partial [Pavlovales sp. CCMP2436]
EIAGGRPRFGGLVQRTGCRHTRRSLTSTRSCVPSTADRGAPCPRRRAAPRPAARTAVARARRCRRRSFHKPRPSRARAQCLGRARPSHERAQRPRRSQDEAASRASGQSPTSLRRSGRGAEARPSRTAATWTAPTSTTHTGPWPAAGKWARADADTRGSLPPRANLPGLVRDTTSC